jgi:RND family efflux transporter MFP subunit
MHAQVTKDRLRRPRSRQSQRRWAVAGAAVAVVAVLAVVVGTNGNGGSSYRTASVERVDVDATIDSLGTIQPVNQATLSFPVSGTVRSVPVTVGQHVTVGQTLAQLDTTALDAQVASARSAVAAAQAKLAADQSSQTIPTVTAAVAPSAFSTQTTSGDNAHAAGTGSSNPASAARDMLTKQQTQLVNDQHGADKDLIQEKRDLATETNICQAFANATNGSAPQVSANHSQRHGRLLPEVGTTAVPPDPNQCQAAITAVVADQAAVDHDQQAVTADLPALSAAIAKFLTTAQAAQPAPSPHPTATPSTARSTRTTAAPTGTENRTAAARRPPSTAPAVRAASPQQLVSDQATIDAAQAQLTEAQQAHDQAELRSPIDGTVGMVTISAGETVPGNSASPQIVVVGAGAHQVTTSVSDTSVGSVRVGDAATVIPSGSSATLHGQVVTIGLLGDSASTGSPGSVSYPVTIGLTDTDQPLFAGQSASVSIMLAHASDTLTVPSSAVHHGNSGSTVTVLRNGTAKGVDVTLGVVGPTRTQVLAGLNSGDQVVIADLSRPLPTTDIQNLRRVTGGGGRPGG